MKPDLYFDYQATTPLATEVVQAITESLTDHWGNPSSLSSFGITAKTSLENARTSIASVLGADAQDIVFTSGGTEANNIVFNSALNYWNKRVSELGCINELPHFIISEIEHPSVMEPVLKLRKDKAITVSFLPVLPTGQVDHEKLIEQLDIHKNTVIVSVMMANNETGVINSIKDISTIIKGYSCKNFASDSELRRIFMHTDAAQAIGKTHVNVYDLGVDYLTVVGHKIYGPKVGALFAKSIGKLTPVFPILSGAGQERGFRPGTENVPMAIGLGKACSLASENLESDMKKYSDLTTYFLRLLKSSNPYQNILFIHVNGGGDNKCKIIPNTVNFSIQVKDKRILPNHHSLLSADLSAILSSKGIAIGRGSACHSSSKASSPVLSAMGVSNELIATALRFSVGRYTTSEEIEIFVKIYWETVIEILGFNQN